ncbi:MAG: hypothetical protein NC127_05290 [Muribaculum sp.]|nr:hypothetical protein [Muribaculum sp.]
MKATILLASLLFGALTGWAEDSIFRMCHDFNTEDDIDFSLPAGFKVFEPEDAVLYINRDTTDYDLYYAGWIYPVMAESESGDCLILYPGSGFDMGGPNLKKYVENELKAVVVNKDLDTSTLIKVIAMDDMSEYANADTAYVYEFDFVKPYMDKYTRCIGVCLRKYAHPGLMMKLALTDEGLAQKDEYLRMMLNSVRYGNKTPTKGVEAEESGSQKFEGNKSPVLHRRH